MRVLSTLVILAVLVFATLILMSLYPPKQLTLAVGPENGGYARVAEKYRNILAHDAIELNFVYTAGSEENAELLSNGRVDAAILQGGIKVSNEKVEAIGLIFSEPLIFLAHERVDVPDNPALWRNLRISSGRVGSGTAVAFDDFQKAVGLEPAFNTHLALSYDDAATALVARRIDIAVFVAPVNAPYLAQAYEHPSIRFVTTDFGEAISRRMGYASTAVIPKGAVSLRPVIPSEPREIVALDARLAIHPDLHPALINRLTVAAIEIHDGYGVIREPGSFPAVDGTDLPVNNAARQLILEGPSTWHDWLPYWMAAQVNRILLLLLPVIFIVFPLLRVLPSLYGYVMGWRVWHFYPEIRNIEQELNGAPDAKALEGINDKLADLDKRLSQLRLPAAYRRASYDARLHVDLVRKRIVMMQQEAAGD